MRNINRVTMIGRLATDPTTKTVQSGHRLSVLRLATNYSWKQQNEWQSGVDYHTIVAWDRLAEQVVANYHTGDGLFIEGKLHTRSWVTEAGDRKFSTEVVAKSVMPVTSPAARKRAGELQEDEPEQQWEREALEVIDVQEPVATTA